MDAILQKAMHPGLKFFAHLGQQRTIPELAAETGIGIYTLYQRWHRGDRDARLVRPLDNRGKNLRGDA